MLGAIIGDIIGSRFEFNNHRDVNFQLFTSGCAFTDDSICTAAVADALLCGVSFAESLRHWCGKYPYPAGGYGGSFARWLASPAPQPYGSYGNGSAMRVSPCAWFFDNRAKVLEYARRSAECTHNHPEGIKGAVSIADCIFHARQDRSGQDCKKRIKTLAVQEYGYTLEHCPAISANNTFNETCQVTVPQAIACFLESTDFESAVRLAVSIGGDTDTICAITGSIAEAHYGIPEHIKTQAIDFLPQDIKQVVFNFNKMIKK